MPTRRAPARDATRSSPRGGGRAVRPPFTASLLLPRAFAAAFGLREAALQELLRGADTGRDAAGSSGCSRALGSVPGGAAMADALRRWDISIGRHEAATGAARAAHALAAGQAALPFRLTHFQWLACAVVEWHLEALVRDAAAHVARIETLRERELPHLPPYTVAEARKLACFMATGAGKTLVLHMNLRQFIAHKLFEPQQVLLITPNESLSRQHAEELQASGLVGLSGLGVRVTEITKFYVDEPGARRPKKGVSEPTSRYEGPNLLLVDEGHKGGGSGGDRDWKAVREALAQGATEAQAGFTFEYSATFAQIADKDEALYDEYARCVAVDFGYARFWREGYGKQPRQINAGQAAGADFALSAGLLAFYQQRLAWALHRSQAREVLAAAPLMACVGKDVTAGGAEADVALLVGFLGRACADGPWLAERLAEVLAGGDPAQAGFDIPPLDLRWLRQHLAERGWGATELAADVGLRVFGGAGRLSVHLISPQELGLKSLGAADDAYFGVMRVGEAKKLADTLVAAKLAAAGEPDRVAGSLFARLEADERLTVLIGAKMFIEGWSSWRVSALGLMNVGRSPGAEIVQLFGRGVRLRGRAFSLQREQDAPLPVQVLQSLQVFGVKADYLQQFLAMLALEGVKTQVLHVPVTLAHEPLAGLGLKTLHTGDERFSGCVAFDPDPNPDPHANAGVVAPEHLCIDPQLRASAGLAGAQALGPAPVLTPSLARFVDAEVAFQHALQVKRRQGLAGLVFSSANLQRWLGRCTVRAPQGWFEHRELGLARRATVALQALEAGLVRAWRQAERRWRMEQLAVVALDEGNAGLPQQMVAGEPRKVWRVEVDVARGVNDTVLAAVRDVVQAGLAPEALITDVQAVLAHHGPHLLDLVPRVQALIENHAELHRDALELPLPRLHGLPHLFTPLLAEKALPSGAAQPAPKGQLGLFDAAEWTPNAAVQIRPPALNPGETTFVWNLRAWWQEHHAHAPWNEVSLYLLRNPAAGGLRLWRDSGFAPDFMLWLQRGPRQVLGLVDPKGLARQWPADKIELIQELETRALSVPVRGALLSVSAPDAAALPPGQSGAPDALWERRVLLQHDPQHLDRLMNHILAALEAAPSP
ncbi:MAG: hypothetical protein ING89_13365 [Rubrivivax sp.]|nr:hypothetical protein [Rubrivivax sp.]